MRTVIVTGSAGLIGSETVKRFAKEGTRVVGIDNDMCARFFGPEASTKKTRNALIANVRSYEYHDLDTRDVSAVTELFAISGVPHARERRLRQWMCTRLSSSEACVTGGGHSTAAK